VVKNLGKKAAAKDLAKKTLANVDLHHQSPINNKTKPNKANPNIDENNKLNSIFSRICLVPCASSVLFDDGEGYMCILCMTVESMIHGYHELYKQTIA